MRRDEECSFSARRAWIFQRRKRQRERLPAAQQDNLYEDFPTIEGRPSTFAQRLGH